MRDRYFDFLCSITDKSNEYSRLLHHLYNIEFYSLIPNDINRVEDGEQFRDMFLDKEGLQGSSCLPNRSCTVLEMLLGVAKRLEFDLLQTRYERSIGEWFWVLIDNLELSYCDDLGYENPKINSEEDVDRVIRNMIDRKYEPSGSGGLFPLNNSEKDQRRIEIWYQMSAWVIENYPI